MKKWLLTALLFIATVTNKPINSRAVVLPHDETTVFGLNPHAPFYWKALTLMMRNNKEAALNVLAALKSDTPPSFIPALSDPSQHSIDDLFDTLFLSYISRDPQLLTQLGLFESLGIREHNAYLTDVSPAAAYRDLAEKKAYALQLKKYADQALSADHQISHKIFSWTMDHALAGEQFLFHEYRINQLFGILAELTIIFTQYHPLKMEEDAHHYVSRLAAIPAQLEQSIELLEHQKNNGIIPPAFTLDKVIRTITNSTPLPVTNSVFYSHFATSLEQIKTTQKNELLAHAATVLESQVYPAYKKLQNYLIELRSQSDTNDGVWALPNGDEYYIHALKRHTTTDITPEEVYELGLKEVEKIQKEMRSLFEAEGMNDNEKSVGELSQELSKDPRFFYPDTAEGRAACIAQYQAILDRTRKELLHLFDIKPKAPVQIVAVPKHEEEGQPGAYYCVPSLDGSRPGSFYINLRSMLENPTYRMETLSIHEAEPGHHFQISLQQETDMPILRKLGECTAYVEGWALYTEKLAYEEGFYSTNFDKIGHLQDELLRAVRLVIDTGIHKKRWTREKAIEYMRANTGFHIDSIVTEIERYFVLPGQACAYKIGQLKILELRDIAKKTLGANFDIREFHNVVLKLGAAPLTILEEVVHEYIRTH